MIAEPMPCNTLNPIRLIELHDIPQLAHTACRKHKYSKGDGIGIHYPLQ